VRRRPLLRLAADAGDHALAPIVGIAACPSGAGYWLVGSDGGVFAFGFTGFPGNGYYGSTGSMQLNEPIVGISATPDCLGYRLVAADGGVFNFGDANFLGSTGCLALNKPAVGMVTTAEPSTVGTNTACGSIDTHRVVIGCWRPTAGCSPLAMPSSSGPPAASR